MEFEKSFIRFAKDIMDVKPVLFLLSSLFLLSENI